METGLTLRMKVRWVEPESVWFLQLGGRVPLVFAGGGTVLIDRNVVGAVVALSRDPERQDFKAERWWLRPLDSEHFLLNPILYAMEGNARRTPTFDEFCAGLHSSRELLRRGFPKARILEHPASGLHAVYQFLRSFAERRAAEQAFLLKVAPMLADRVRISSRRAAEDRILAEARSAGLLSRSLLVLCALSCLYERADGAEPMIGRGVLNPTATYTEADAYNAIADVQCLELLSSAAAREEESFGLVTRDRYLAALWCALGVSAPSKGEDGWTITLAPGSDLFPSLHEAQVAELLGRMH
jgi:hypothetical protein